MPKSKFDYPKTKNVHYRQGDSAKMRTERVSTPQIIGVTTGPTADRNQQRAMRQIVNSVKSGASEAAKKHSLLNKSVKFGQRLSRFL